MEETQNTFGSFIKSKRISLGITLRAFCLENGFDPGNLSKMERDIAQAPQEPELQEKLAKCLKIEKESEDWQTFVDLASASNGRIPQDLMQDADVVRQLPTFLRTLRNEKLSGDQLDSLIKKIKET